WRKRRMPSTILGGPVQPVYRRSQCHRAADQQCLARDAVFVGQPVWLTRLLRFADRRV
ncbi:hypothetical protein PENSUB_3452, partial [Penicillium subrubescens]